MRIGELGGRVLTIGRTGLTRLVDRLEAAGMLTRAHCASDRRGVEVSITAAGSALLRKMWPVYARVIRERFAGALAESAAVTLTGLL